MDTNHENVIIGRLNRMFSTHARKHMMKYWIAQTNQKEAFFSGLRPMTRRPTKMKQHCPTNDDKIKSNAT